MYQQTYFVPKTSGTIADALLAYGVANVLRALIQHRPGRSPHRPCLVRIEDRGYYLIHLPEPIQPEWIEQSDVLPTFARPIVRIPKPKVETDKPTKSKPVKKALPDGLSYIDYNAIWDEIRKVNALIEAQKNQKGRVSREEILELRSSLEEQEYRDVGLLLGDYRMQVEAIHNKAVVQWHTTVSAGFQAANLRALLKLFASPSTDRKAIAKQWAKEVPLRDFDQQLTVSQVYNPSMGKGQNHPKADYLSMGNEKEFWLIEYLKAVGLFQAAIPRSFADENMRKTYVVAPANIEVANHARIFKTFERSFTDIGLSPIKTDILTSLDYASAYLSYCIEGRLEGNDEINLNPQNSIKGFYVATYVLLSKNAFTTISLSFLGLPPWLQHIESVEDVIVAQEIIEQHQAIIRLLNEKFQEGSTLLDAYRDFLTGQRTDAFLDFCAGYGEYVLRSLSQTIRIRQISAPSLDEIFRRISMEEHGTAARHDLTEFSQSSGRHPGFHSIAYAIRQSTVRPQRQNAQFKSKQRTKGSLYDVRYGLGNNLKRSANKAEDFIQALMDFIHQYNAETQQVYEKTSEERRQFPDYAKNHYRRPILEDALDDILDLVKGHGPELVCSMLVAYGYASTGVTKDAIENGQNAGTEVTTSNGEED